MRRTLSVLAIIGIALFLGNKLGLSQPEKPAEGLAASLKFDAAMKPHDIDLLQLRLDELYLNFHWCLFHENVRLFDDSEPGIFRDVNAIRADCIRVQAGNSHAQDMIRAASNDLLIGLAQRSSLAVEADHQLWQNFSWVAYHEHQRDAFRAALARRDFNAIRDIYRSSQMHNPNSRYILAEVSNGTLRVLVNAL